MSYHSIFRSDAFQDKVIIITGGGSGIGRCTAHELSALGAQVVITGRKQEKLDKVSQEIIEDGGKVHSIVCDNREEQQVKEMIAEIIEKFGRLDGLVNKPESAKNWLPGGYVKGGYPKDSWENDLQYVIPGAEGRTFDLYSFGADAKEGGEGNDADIYYQP